jgi:sigma-B regulation protein RsbU (phosphoserine phosphatase)
MAATEGPTVPATGGATTPPVADYSGRFFRIAARCRQSDVVGGDFYMLIQTDDRTRLTFVLGDVAGKGAAAAGLAGFLVGVFKGAEARGEPVHLLEHANRAMLSLEQSSQFAVAWCLRLSDDGTLAYANAGAVAPLLFRREGVTRLDSPGLPIGVFPDVISEESRVVLSAGDTLVLFSDGVSEALGPNNEEFGEHRVRELVARHAHREPAEIADALLAQLEAFCGSAAFNDDVTVVIIRYVAEARGAK